MSNVLIVLGSTRKGRVADTILQHVQEFIATRDDIKATVVDLKETDLPFFENEHPPSSPDYVITDERVQNWSTLVKSADSIIFITPEYNHTLSAVQKNAIDTLYTEWENKPIVAVAYGWSGGSQSIDTLNDILPRLKADFKKNPAQLVFTKDLNPDGSVIDQANTTEKIKAAISEI